MPKQEFGYEDLMGVLAVWCVFFAVIGVITVTCINFCCINEYDDVTVLEKWGHKKRLGVRLGIHKRAVIQRTVDMEKFKADIK
ncbi:unnamed protein product [Caenorhabditis angaria]|uniref:Uncharacterized protein n=1 Tax=Caenorhabditis angaria TaxID=860376 RepID=A0A9P1N0M4_9PELO|nr:unnamed protein product [Caenorhabditis angaria]